MSEIKKGDIVQLKHSGFAYSSHKECESNMGRRDVGCDREEKLVVIDIVDPKEHWDHSPNDFIFSFLKDNGILMYVRGSHSHLLNHDMDVIS